METEKDPSQPGELSGKAHAEPAMCPFHTSGEFGFEAFSPDLCKGFAEYTGCYPGPSVSI